MPVTGRLARQYEYRCDCSDNAQGLKPHEMFTMAVLANANSEKGDNDNELAINKLINRVAEQWIAPLSEDIGLHSMIIYEGYLYHQYSAPESEEIVSSKLDYCLDNGIYIEVYPVKTNTDTFVEQEFEKLKKECAAKIEELKTLANAEDASESAKANYDSYIEALKQVAEDARPVVAVEIGEYSSSSLKNDDGTPKQDANGHEILIPAKKIGDGHPKYKNETYWTKANLETYSFVKVENAVWSTL